MSLHPPSTQTHRRCEPGTLDTATQFEAQRKGYAGPKVAEEILEVMLKRSWLS